MLVVAAVVIVLVGAGWSSACGGGDRDAADDLHRAAPRASSGRCWSSSREENDVAIDVRYGDTNDLALLIGTEGDRSPADVYWGQSPGATAYLAEQRPARAAARRACSTGGGAELRGLRRAAGSA